MGRAHRGVHHPRSCTHHSVAHRSQPMPGMQEDPSGPHPRRRGSPEVELLVGDPLPGRLLVPEGADHLDARGSPPLGLRTDGERGRDRQDVDGVGPLHRSYLRGDPEGAEGRQAGQCLLDGVEGGWGQLQPVGLHQPRCEGGLLPRGQVGGAHGSRGGSLEAST